MKTTFFFLISLFFISCSNIERMDTKRMKELVKSEKIKRITKADINTKAEALGSQLADSLTATFLKTPATSCNWQNNDLVQSLTKEYGVKIRLLGMADAQEDKNLYAKEIEVLQAYAYNVENKLSVSSNLQKMGDSLLIYTVPVDAKTNLGKSCFGNETHDFAIWSLVFPSKEVIRRM